MNQDQKRKLHELIENYANDREHHYFVGDQGTTSKQVDEAEASLESSRNELFNYIESLTR